MKKLLSVLLLLFISFSLGSCSSQKEEFDTVYNYLLSFSLLNSEDRFIITKNNVPFVFSAGKGSGYSVIENAIELTGAKNRRAVYADADSFCYSVIETSSSYGSGNGYRIYKYDFNHKKSYLMFSDVSITNFDSMLGLEDVFQFSPPTSGHAINLLSGFYIDGNRVIPDYVIKQRIQNLIDKNKLRIELPATGLRFAVTNHKVYFLDVLGTLWQYDPAAQTIEKFYPDAVSDFFVTEKNLFLISRISNSIDVLDLSGNNVKTCDITGISFPAYSLNVSNGECCLKDDNGRIWYIDSDLNMYQTLFTTSTGYWCFLDGQIMLYEDECRFYDLKSGLHTKHDYQIVSVTEPTCSEPGCTEFACICGDTYTSEIEMLPHEPSARTSCEEAVVCVKCGTILEPATEHSFDPTGVYNNDATCLDNGTVTYKCTRCGFEKTEEAPDTALGHDMSGEYKYNNDATCTEDGTETVYCARCDYSETRTAENTALGHVDQNNDGLCDRCQSKIGERPLSIVDFLRDTFQYLRKYLMF